jgi:ATP-binding cassette subfamily B protein
VEERDVKSEKKLSDRELFSVLWDLVKSHRLLFYFVITFLILNTALAISTPLIYHYILKTIEEGVTSTTPSKPIIYAGIAYIVISISSWLGGAILFTFITLLNARVIRDLRINSYKAILQNNILFFDEQKSGDITSRVVNDTKELYESARDIAWLLTNAFRLITTLIVSFYFSIYITAGAMIFIPIVLFLAFLLGRWERRVSAVWRKRFGEVNERFSETMSKIQISKAFNRETENLNRFNELNEATFKASVKRGFAIFLFWPVTDLLQHAFLLIILGIGTWEVSRGLPIATLILFLLFRNYFYWPLISIANNYHRFQGAFASLERITRITHDESVKELDQGSLIPDDLKGSIVFDKLSFGYDPEIPVLEDISFNVNPGERIALVGHTGAGKSTIASLVMRFYTPQKGLISLDDQSLESYQLSSLRGNISLVSQRVLLFKGSIRENLLVVNSELSDDDLWNALDNVQAREFIELLPDGLDTIVLEKGRNLSVGQRQMISFARALLADPKVIILDEATASVDLYTESKIQDAIDTLLSKRTSISIAHRLTTILKSDKIIVLENGKIVQQGTHEQLITQKGQYQDMYQLYFETQSAKYLEEIKVSG